MNNLIMAYVYYETLVAKTKLDKNSDNEFALTLLAPQFRL